MRALLAGLAIPLIGTAVLTAATYPPDRTLEPATMPAQPMPGYLQPVTDQTYGTTITRVSDRAAFGSTRDHLTHEYATMPAWNCDQTMLLLMQTGYPNVILDARDYTILGRHSVPSGATWSYTNPDVMYGGATGQNTLLRYTVSAKSSATWFTFGDYTSIKWAGENNLCQTDSFAAVLGYKGSELFLVTFDMTARSIIAEKSLGNLAVGDTDPNGVNAIMMSARGGFVVVFYKTKGTGPTQGWHLYDRNLNYVRFFQENSAHCDMGVDPQGNEVLVSGNSANDRSIVMVRFSDNVKTVLMSGAKMSYSIHISCRNFKRPGWCYLSDFGAPSGNNQAYAAWNKVFAIKMDGSQTVQVFGWEHRSTSEDYYHSPRVCASPDGSKVIFCSDWGDDAGPVYSYVAEYRPAAGSGQGATLPASGALRARLGTSPGRSFTLKGEVHQSAPTPSTVLINLICPPTGVAQPALVLPTP